MTEKVCVARTIFTGTYDNIHITRTGDREHVADCGVYLNCSMISAYEGETQILANAALGVVGAQQNLFKIMTACIYLTYSVQI